MPDRLEPDWLAIEQDWALLKRAQQRRERALEIIHDLCLLERWAEIGAPVVVGAAAHDLMVSPDVDLEVFTPTTPRIAEGFRVLAALAEHPRVTRTRTYNGLNTPDAGLYWQLRYVHPDGQEWKVDTWTLAHDHPGPLGARLAAVLRDVLTREQRVAILELKEARLASQIPAVASIDLYRAVVDAGVRTPAELTRWVGGNYAPALTAWLPGQR